MAGDFNIHIESQNESYGMEFLSLIQQYSLHQSVSFPTHIHGGFLDLVISNNENFLPSSSVHVQYDKLSDHYPVFFDLLPPYVTDQKHMILSRDWKNFNLKNFKEELLQSNLCNPLHYNYFNSSTCIELYNDTISKLFNKHCPIISKTYNHKCGRSKWFNPQLADMKRRKRRLERLYLHQPTSNNRHSYLAAKNNYNFMLKATRHEYFFNQIAGSGRDTSK